MPGGRTPVRFPGTRSNAATRSRNTLQFTHPLSIQVEVGCPPGLQFFVDVRLGRNRPFGFFVGWLWLRVKRADGDSEPLARAVGGRITRSKGRWRPCPIKSAESCRAQHRPVVLQHQGIWPVTHSGLGEERLQSVRRFMVAKARSVRAQGRHQPVHIEGGFVFEHEIDGAGQLDGQHRIGLKLVAIHPCL